MSLRRPRRPSAPSAWDVVIVTEWGGRSRRVTGPRSAAVAAARQEQAADPLAIRVRIIPA